MRIIGLSIDESLDTVRDYIEEQQLTLIEHYHVRNGLCDAEIEFGVKGIPIATLVGKEGIIAFTGHSAKRDFEVDIYNLLEGKELTGEGVETGDPVEDDDGAWIPNIDDAVAELVLDRFEASSLRLFNSADVRRTAADMQRCLCVLVHEQRHACRVDKREHKMNFYSVLAGKQESIDQMKEHFEPFDDEKWGKTYSETVINSESGFK